MRNYYCRKIALKCNGFRVVILSGINKYLLDYAVSVSNTANTDEYTHVKKSLGLSIVSRGKWSKNEV